MDPLAHSLFGAALARTRLGRDGLGRDIPAAGVTLVVAANLPDVDVLSYFAGGDAALAFRRGWTHGPLGLLVLPWLWLVLLWLYRRWRGPSRAVEPGAGSAPRAFSPRLVVLAYLGALSHPALDWMNTYGVRLGMPFDRRWFYGDVLFIVDPWMWLLLGAAAFLGARCSARSRRLWLTLLLMTSLAVMLAVPWVARGLWLAGVAALVLLDRSWARSPPEAWSRQRTATLLVGLFLLYLGAMWFSAAASRSEVRAELVRTGVGPVEEIMVGPLPGTPFRREVVVVTPQQVRFGTFRWWGGERLELGEQRWIPLAVTLSAVPAESQVEGRAVAAALADPCIAGFIDWMRFPIAEVEETGDGTLVHLFDLRYTRQRTRGFGGAQVLLGASGVSPEALEPAAPRSLP